MTTGSTPPGKVRCVPCDGRGFVLVRMPRSGVSARRTCSACSGSGYVPCARFVEQQIVEGARNILAVASVLTMRDVLEHGRFHVGGVVKTESPIGAAVLPAGEYILPKDHPLAKWRKVKD